SPAAARTVGWCTTATRCAPASNPASSPDSPVPITTWYGASPPTSTRIAPQAASPAAASPTAGTASPSTGNNPLIGSPTERPTGWIPPGWPVRWTSARRRKGDGRRRRNRNWREVPFLPEPTKLRSAVQHVGHDTEVVRPYRRGVAVVVAVQHEHLAG